MIPLEKGLISFAPEQPIEVVEGDIFKNDLLNHREFVERLSSIMKGVKPPFTLGVYGEWGTGKTSAMGLLKALLDQNQYPTCWFDAWKYEGQDNLLFPLFKSIETQCKPQKADIREAKKIAAVIGLAIGNQLLLRASLPSIWTFKKLSNFYDESFQSKLETWTDNASKLGEYFSKFVCDLVEEKGGQPLIIFIDDLDRCLPDRAIALLESIKNFLSVPNCVFVIGVDDQVIAKGIRKKYGEGLIDGQSYLEKMVMLPFRVPQPKATLIKDYVLYLFSHSLDNFQPSELASEIQSCASTLGQIQFSNPRRLRRVVY